MADKRARKKDREFLCSKNRKITKTMCVGCSVADWCTGGHTNVKISTNGEKESIHNKHVTHTHTHICQTKINFYIFLSYCCLRDYFMNAMHKRNIENRNQEFNYLFEWIIRWLWFSFFFLSLLFCECVCVRLYSMALPTFDWFVVCVCVNVWMRVYRFCKCLAWT